MIELLDSGLHLIAPIERAISFGYTLTLNELTTAQLVLPAGDEIADMIDVPASWLRVTDGDEYTGLFRFASCSGDEHGARATLTYTLEGAEATLLDDTLIGWHELGGGEIQDEGAETATEDAPEGAEEWDTPRVLRYILDHQTERRWTLGRCDFTDKYQYNFEDVTLLEAVMSLGEVILEDYAFVFDTGTTPWTVSFIRLPDTPLCALVYGRNVTAIRRSVDGRVVTRLVGRGYGEGDNQLTIAGVNDGLDYIDADAETIARYGIRVGTHVDRRQTDAATLKAHMERILERGKRPKASYELSAIDLHRLTGEASDCIGLGDQAIILDEGAGGRQELRVTRIQRGDILGNPGDIRYTIAAQAEDIEQDLNEILEKIGVQQLYSQGATNMYSMQVSDNCDSKNPLEVEFYVPGNVLRINSVRIRWKADAFRTHVRAAAAGGGGTTTSAGGEGLTIAGVFTTGTTTPTCGGPVDNEGAADNVTGGAQTAGNTHNHNMWHKHNIGSHSHSISDVKVQLEKHKHSVSIPEHTHDMDYGIYKGTRAGSVSIKVDGAEIPAEEIPEEREMDIVRYLRAGDDGRVTRGTWHKVAFTPDKNSRIMANLFFQVFIQSRGAGDY